MKTVYIPEQTKIKAESENIADMMGYKYGFKRGSKEWEKAFQNAVVERYMYSSSTGINKEANPHSPMLPDDVFKKFEIFSINGVLRKTTKNNEYVNSNEVFNENFRSFKGAVSILTTLYCYSVLGLKIEDFNLPLMDGWNEEKKKEKILETAGNIYARYLATTAMLAALEPVFNVKPQEIAEVLTQMELDKKPIEALRNKTERDRFLTHVTNFMRNFFGKSSIFKQS